MINARWLKPLVAWAVMSMDLVALQGVTLEQLGVNYVHE